MSGTGVDAADVRGFSVFSAVGRIAIGAGMLTAPELSMRALGFSEVTPATAAVARIAGVRDLVLGAVTLAALDDPARLRAASLANAVADSGDTAAFAAALGSAERTAGARGLAAALPAALAGFWVSWRLS